MSAARRRPGTVEVPPTPLNATDATLWDIERNPALRTTIVAALVLDRAVARERLVNLMEAATRQVPRLRQRVVERRGGVGVPHWEIDPGFELAGHVRFVEVPGEVDEAVIAAVAEPMASAPFDRTRPLWECVHVAAPAGSAAVVLKVHHSLTDGVGGMGILDSILDRAADAPPRDLSRIPVPVPTTRHPERDLGRLVERAVSLPFDVAGAVVTTTFHPRRVADELWRGTRSAVRLLGPSSAPLSPLLVGRGLERRLAVGDIELERLRRAASRHDCTVNDAFFAGVVGGLADYHRELGTPTERLRVTMPVSFRRAGHAGGGNQWAPVRFVVPADIGDPLERMYAMSELVRSRKSEPAISFSQRLAGLVQVLPSVLSSSVVAGMVHGVDATLTNVPGLTMPHFLGGASVDRVYAFAPAGGAALNISLVSHVDTACIGTLCDADAVTEPALLHELVVAGLDEVVDAADRRRPSRSVPARPLPPAPRSDRLTALDAGFLRLESADTPMHLGAVFVLDGDPLRDTGGALRVDEIERHVDARVRRVPQLTRRVAEVPLGLGRPLWVDDESFDIRQHLFVTAVDPPGDRLAFLDRCTELLREPLDRSRPLWQLWLIDGLADGRVGIVEKLHHALVDGIGGVDIASALFDVEPDVDVDTPVRTRVAPAPSSVRLLAGAVAGQLADPARTAGRIVAATWRAPGTVAAQVASVAGAARELARPGAHTPRTSFNRHVGPDRVVRTVEIGLAEVRAIGAPAGATVNDVVLAAVTGGVVAWMDEHGEHPPELHAVVPVSVRGRDDRSLGNHVGAVLVALPVGERDPLRRLQVVEMHMRRLKAAHEGQGAAAVLDTLDHVPGIDRLVGRLVAAQPFANLVVTNVPGSPVPLHLLGARIDEMIPVVPLGPGLGLGIAILTYAGRMTISLAADPALCPDVDRLAEAVTAALAELAAATA